MKVQIIIVPVCISLALSLGPSVTGQEPKAEQLYRSNQGQGLKLSIELKRGGTTRSVSPQTTFVTGDEIKLHFTANFDGYVYALDETPSGKTIVLFPTTEAGTFNLVQAGHDYTIPATDGWFRFVGEAGVERIHMIASARPIPAIGAPATAGSSTNAKAAVPANPTPPPAAPINPAVSPTQVSQSAAATTVPTPHAAAKNSKVGKQATSTYSQVQKDVGKVQGGVSLTKTVTGLPKSIKGIFSGLKGRDIFVEDDQQDGLTYVASPVSLSDQPVYFLVELVHK